MTKEELDERAAHEERAWWHGVQAGCGISIGGACLMMLAVIASAVLSRCG